MSENYDGPMNDGSDSQKVLLIGLDGADFGILDKLIDEGKLPTLSSLISKGVSAELESSTPPWTPTAWTSLTSGQNPGKHGIFDFKTPDGERLVNATDVRANRIWDYMTANDRTSIIVNVPVTHPAPKLDGVLIPGYLGPTIEDATSHPEGIIDELEQEIGQYRIYAADDYKNDTQRCEEFRRLLRMRRDAIIYLCQNYNWQFAMVEFQRTDTVFHELPEERFIERVFTAVDSYINDILESIDYDTVMIASDHGMGPTGSWDFRVNTWLKQQGYLETTLHGRATGWEKPTKRGSSSWSPLYSLATGLSRIGLTPRRFQSLLKRMGLSGFVLRMLPSDVIIEGLETAGEKIDQEESNGFCPSGPGLGIYCEEQVVDELIHSLETLRDPDGNLVNEWVAPAREVWAGPQVELGPDVLFLPKEMDYYVSASITAEAFDKSSYHYNHKTEGVLIAAGVGVDSGGEREKHSIYDVTPTILSLSDLPLDTSFDGRVIEKMSSHQSLPEKNYQEYHQRMDSFEDEAIQSRLEELGYMN